MKKSLMVLKFTLKNSSQSPYAKRIEYILEGNLLEKSVKRPFCCTGENEIIS